MRLARKHVSVLQRTSKLLQIHFKQSSSKLLDVKI